MNLQAVAFTLTADDLVDAQNYVQRPVLLMGKTIGAAALLIGAILLLSGGETALGLIAIVYGLLDLAVVGLRPLRRMAIARRSARVIGSRVEFVLDPDTGLRWVEGGGSGQIVWSALSAVREDGRILAFVSGGAVRATIPKRAFASGETLIAFRAEAQRLVAAPGD